jgi:hypothetical protein
MRSIRRRLLVAAAALGLVTVPSVRSVLTEATVQANELAETLPNIERHVQTMQTMLGGLDPRSFMALLGLINEITYDYRAVVGGIASVGQTLESVNTAFQTASSCAKIRGFHAQWRASVLASTQVAAHAQLVIHSWRENADAVAAVVAQAPRAPRASEPLQSIVRMLRVLHDESRRLLRTLGTTERVLRGALAADIVRPRPQVDRVPGRSISGV